MKLLFAQGLPYLSISGSTKANRTLAEMLAARGHEVTFISLARAAGPRLDFIEELRARSIPVTTSGAAHVFELHGVRVHSLAGALEIPRYLSALIEDLAPDWILVSTEDWRQQILSGALQHDARRVVYLAHTIASLPVGPYRTEAHRADDASLLQRVRGVVAPCQFVADWVRRWTGETVHARVFYFPAYGPGPFPRYDNHASGAITLINPCGLKGLPIFADVARALPQVRFAAIPTWGTMSEDLALLATLPNVEIWPASENIDEHYARTSVLLMPSLWLEVFGLSCIDAMLRGIPVVASDSGGLPEAKLGTDMILPVRLIERYKSQNGSLIPIEPPMEDAAPWIDLARRLSADRAFDVEMATAAHAAASAFFSRISQQSFEDLLQSFE